MRLAFGRAYQKGRRGVSLRKAHWVQVEEIDCMCRSQGMLFKDEIFVMSK